MRTYPQIERLEDKQERIDKMLKNPDNSEDFQEILLIERQNVAEQIHYLTKVKNAV